MTDDIVEKLRMQANLINAFPKMKAANIAPTKWLFEAIDEIERLRVDRDRFEAIAEQAIKNLETAMAIIEQLQGAVHRD